MSDAGANFKKGRRLLLSLGCSLNTKTVVTVDEPAKVEIMPKALKRMELTG